VNLTLVVYEVDALGVFVAGPFEGFRAAVAQAEDIAGYEGISKGQIGVVSARAAPTSQN